MRADLTAALLKMKDDKKDSGITKGALLEELRVEVDELVAIFTAIGKKSK